VSPLVPVTVGVPVADVVAVVEGLCVGVPVRVRVLLPVCVRDAVVEGVFVVEAVIVGEPV
jgi:hypothetical protein